MSTVLRDVFIQAIYKRMSGNRRLFFLSADFGAPMLDKLRSDFPDRFINVGIAEQNLVATATGLALEGCTVIAYAIAPFLVMRAYEQIRNNVSMLSSLRPLNVNLVGVGAGLGYDLSGPTHHCLEDLGIMRMLPNIEVLSPSDQTLVELCVDYLLAEKRPKYIRLDGKSLPRIYAAAGAPGIRRGFCEIRAGGAAAIVATGYMTHKALRICRALRARGAPVGVIDVFAMKKFDRRALVATLNKYQFLLTLEEGFVGKGGLDSLILDLAAGHGIRAEITNRGFSDSYIFTNGTREVLHEAAGLSDDRIMEALLAFLRPPRARAERKGRP